MGTRHRSIIAVDPGATTGWASFGDGMLQDAGTCKSTVLELPFVPFWPAIVIIEKPVVYSRIKCDPNDLILLALIAGEIAGSYHATDVQYVTPRAWKGTLPKPVSNRRTLAALTSIELGRLPRRPRAKDFDHNMLDAIGIGLWQLEREGQR